MYKELLSKPQSPEFTARVLSYEIGDIHKYMIYQERFGPVGYVGNLKVSCADTFIMINLLCEQLGFDLDEIKAFGLERFKERMGEIKDGKQ